MVKLLDTHQHLIFPNRFSYKWTNAVPALRGKEFGIGLYRELTIGRDVAASIFMEVDADERDYQDETRFVSNLADDPINRIAGIISSCRPEQLSGFDAWLEECTNLPVVGFRRILHEVDDDLSTTRTFRNNVSKIGSRGLTFDMVFRADQLKIAMDLAIACDNTSFILDHCGVPDIAGGAFEQWSADILRIARLPNVNCKISGILAYCAEGQANADTVRPYIEHVIECFGPERLLWGSDWPVVNIRSALPEWIDMFRLLVEKLSDDEQEAVCNLNAQRIYGVRI